jgi:hypothetical protein
MPRTLPDISVPNLAGQLAVVTGGSDGIGSDWPGGSPPPAPKSSSP